MPKVPSIMRSSLSRNFLLALGAASVAFTILSTLCAFAAFQQELIGRQMKFLSQYVQERTANVDRQFSSLTTLHRSAVQELDRRLAHMTPAQADEIADRYYPLRPDGTRRTRPEVFDGMVTPGGSLVYGMGGFLADGAHIAPDEKAALAAAFSLVSSFGKAAHGEYDNFYFFTPRNRMIMFGPDRPDRLLFYRQTAPANLDFKNQEMVRLLSRDVSQSGLTRCTSLQHLIQDDHRHARVATACVTPAYVHGRLVGGFGSSINLTSFLTNVVSSETGGASNLIVRGDGELIAYPGFTLPGLAPEQTVKAYQQRLGLKDLVRRAAAQRQPYGVLVSADHRHIIAYGRLTGPGWYLFMSYPAAALTWSAFRSAAWLLVVGLGVSILQTLVILHLTRRKIVTPLQDLAASCQPGGRNADTDALEHRRDEIGVLARALRMERDRADGLLCSLEQRVQARTSELERANTDLERASTEKSRFLANMSHELRTPLNGVIAISETLAHEQTTPRNVELAQLIVSSGRLLEQVLTDILDFSKIEAGEMRLERAPFDLATAVSRVARLHKASAEAKGIELGWYVDPQVAGAYLGDPVRLTQVMSNLLSNGVKFTDRGGVTARAEAVEGGVRFSVTDSGIGFDDEVKARLFQRFEQADASIRRRFGGTGLGLAICRSLVELMGGEIDATSQPGCGSTFSFVLPLEAAPVARAAPAAEPELQADLAGVRILLAEDHPTNQRVVRLILDAAGVDLAIVENGAAALDALAAADFDVVLMDMQMPELDGLSATAMLREREAAAGARRIPVIMLTANALDEHVRASLEAGADRHLSKPLRPLELLEAIATVLRAPAPEAAGTVARSAA